MTGSEKEAPSMIYPFVILDFKKYTLSLIEGPYINHV